MKYLPKLLLALYLLVLLWLVLFKFSYDFWSVLSNYQTRSLNLIPFAGASRGTIREMIDNVVVFVPFGLLLGTAFKRVSFGKSLMVVFVFSLLAEITQYVLAIGTTDVTDVITNTLGGLMGLAAYDAARKRVNEKGLDRFIIIAGWGVLVAFAILRIFVFRVRY